MKRTVKIRRAVRADYEQIVKLVTSFPTQLMSEVPSVTRFFVALEDSEIVGCCALDIYSKRIAEIRSLAVNRKYQGQGLGTALVQKCLQLATKKGIGEVFAITGKPEFFKRLGLATFQNERVAVFKQLT